METSNESLNNKAVVVIGDGLGNVVAQTPLVIAVTQLFKKVSVWLPRSHPDVATIIEGIPGVVSVTTEHTPGIASPDAVFQSWLVNKQAKRIQPRVPGARFCGPDPYRTRKNEVEACLQAARACGWRGPSPHPFLSCDTWPYDIGLNQAEPVFGFSTGRNTKPMWRFKEYPPVSFSKVIDDLANRYPTAQFVQVGTVTDAKIPHERVIDTRGLGTLRETLGLVRTCALFCGNDTGLCWAANAMHVPTVVVFGPTCPIKSLPPWGAQAVQLSLPCQPCHRLGRIGYLRDRRTRCGHECMLQLSPDIVTRKAIETYEATQKTTE